jgi:uncharacterized protein YegL
MAENEYGLDPVECPVARVPVMFIVDTNGGTRHEITTADSTRSDIIFELNEGLEHFAREIEGDFEAELAVDVSVISTGGDLTVEQGFQPIQHSISTKSVSSGLPELTAGGMSRVSESIVKSQKHLIDYIESVDKKALSRKPAMVWLLHESEPLDGFKGSWERAQRVIKMGTEDRHMFFFAVGLGGAHRGAAMEGLNRLVTEADDENVAVFGHRYRYIRELFHMIANVTIEYTHKEGLSSAAEAFPSGALDPGIAILSKSNLPKANLSEADLSEQDISEANLAKADLSEANLTHADLSNADLRDADLSDANLTHAGLSEADFRGIDLEGATMDGEEIGLRDIEEAGGITERTPNDDN